MRTPLQPALVDLLSYLKDIGYTDVYKARSVAASGPLSTGTGERAGERGNGINQDSPELASLRTAAEVCTRCRLAQGRQKVVFGAGSPVAELMLIGEAPGAEEDKQGLPFVGAAGELLTKIIQAMDMRRDDIYIANILKCRPPGNRDPQPDEIAACRGFLERQIELIQPKVIVALGRIAAQALLGNDGPLGQMRGQWYSVQGVPTMVTYHPAALLRNQGLKRPTWEDMQQVRDRLRQLRV
ncbi:MAG TPA: uracil-DNA glycosylase [Thermoanaerobaculia bacterium]|nr:uracil-DNA glycosylase [Thermoanaerobaculia bacterium]